MFLVGLLTPATFLRFFSGFIHVFVVSSSGIGAVFAIIGVVLLVVAASDQRKSNELSTPLTRGAADGFGTL